MASKARVTTVPMALVRDAYARLSGGGHWFDRSTMRFFRSMLSRSAYVGPGGVYFVSSEQFDDGARRAYTVRAWRGSDVATVGDFNVASRETALARAKAAAAGA